MTSITEFYIMWGIIVIALGIFIYSTRNYPN